MAAGTEVGLEGRADWWETGGGDGVPDATEVQATNIGSRSEPEVAGEICRDVQEWDLGSF